MAYTTINKSTDYFNTVTYAGDGNTTQAITNTFQTDFSWIKHRGTTAAHTLQDAVRGFDLTKKLSSNTTDAENNASGATWENYGGVSAVGATSFTVSLGSNTPYQTNANGANYVAWNWKAGTTGSGYTTGSGTSKAYSYSVNTTAGFSIIKFEGNGTAGHTIPHHLGVAPKMVIAKNRDNTGGYGWYVQNTNLGTDKVLYLHSTDAQATNTTAYNSTHASSTVVTLGTNSGTNGNGENIILYCFAEKTGYSKLGSYTGNGSTDGTFVYTGFKPTWVLIKKSSAVEDWAMFDSTRDTYNVQYKLLYGNGNNAEYTGVSARNDFLSNGFKIRTTDNKENGSGGTYIYMAFGQSLVGSNNVPCTAR